MENKLTNAKSIRSFLDEAFKDGIENVKRSKMHKTALSEKDKQQSLAATSPAPEGEDDSLGAALSGPGDDEGSDEQPQPDQSDDSSADVDPEQQAHDKEAMQNDDVKLDDVIDKLNTIRSGKSFKDSAIKSAMENYIDDLEKPERTALLAFLKGIAQIVTGEIPGEKATEPSENPSSVQMTKDKNASSSSGNKPQQKKSIKPNVIRSPGADQKPQKSAGGQGSTGAENTAGPMPVSPKRRG